MKLLTSDIWNRAADNALMRNDVYKTKQGITWRLYEENDLIQEVISPRPYQLGQACDGTIDDCVHALFILYCRDKHLDPQALYRKAYPDCKNPYNAICQKAIVKVGLAQGIAIPKKWGDDEFEGLYDSLTEINNHSLAQILEEEVGSLHMPLPLSCSHL